MLFFFIYTHIYIIQYMTQQLLLFFNRASFHTVIIESRNFQTMNLYNFLWLFLKLCRFNHGGSLVSKTN